MKKETATCVRMDKFAWEQNNNKTLVFIEKISSLITWEIY